MYLSAFGCLIIACRRSELIRITALSTFSSSLRYRPFNGSSYMGYSPKRPRAVVSPDTFTSLPFGLSLYIIPQNKKGDTELGRSLSQYHR